MFIVFNMFWHSTSELSFPMLLYLNSLSFLNSIYF